MIDILKHELVPRHEVLSKNEKEEVLEKFNVKEDHLPKILVSDPAIKNMNAKPGDVVRVIRKSQTAGQSIYYRTVVGD